MNGHGLHDCTTTLSGRGAIMKLTVRTMVALMLWIAPVAAHAAAVPKTPSSGDVKRELSQYFAHIAENSPTMLGAMAKSPDAMAAVQQRIATMSDQELAGFRKLMAEAPDWKVAPEMFAKAFPPEIVGQVQRVGSDYASRIPRGEEMRDDVQTLATVLKMLPDAKLKELGIDRATVTSLEETIAGITPLQAAVLHREASERGPWDARSAAALAAIPPALQRGSAALSEHGPLTDKDVSELGSFRTELTALLARIDKLPEETRKSLKVDQFRLQLRQLDTAAPDVLFMVRHNIPPEMLTTLEENVTFLERVASLDKKELKELEQFRSELTSAFQTLEKKSTEPAGDSPDVKEMLDGLTPAHLMLLRTGMSQFGHWQAALPVFYQTLTSPELPARMALVQGKAADPQAIANLEAFRKETFAEIDAAAQTPGIEADLIQRARERLASVPLNRLELMRMTLESMPKGASRADRLAVVALHEINFGCSVDMPSPVPDINLDFICNPIEDALEAIEHGIIGTVNTIVASVKSTLDTAINSMSSVLTTAINTVTATVNSLVSAITNTVSTISSFVRTIPDLAWSAIKSALNLLLDIQIRNGVTLRDLAASGVEHGLTSMKTMVGLAGDWWSAVSTFTLPAIPCPPAGFHTPFGDVGDGAASANYGRYKLLISNLIGLIPDTETSLQFKIPAQILYLMYDFLGVCLDQASADADSAQATARHNLVLTNFANLEAHIRSKVAGLALANNSNTSSLTTLITSQGASVRNTVLAEGAAIQGLVNNRSASTQTLIRNESTEIRSLIRSENSDAKADVSAFRSLSLRLAIQRVLQAGEGKELALFQLLEPLGYLGVVSDVVRETIAGMGASSLSTGLAQKYYDDGRLLMNAGREKEAFRTFGKAYRAATSQ